MGSQTVPLFEDWQSKTPYPHSIWRLFQEQIGCDVVFEVGPDLERIGAHSTILMSRSCVLLSEFAAGVPEREIQLSEFQPEEFSCFLEFLYTGALNITGISSVKVLALAEKYKVSELIKSLVATQLEGMLVDEFCPFVRKNEKHMTDLIKFKCLEYAFENAEAIFQSGTFQTLPLSFLKELLAHDRLVLNEEIICTAVLLWASKECEMRRLDVNGQNQRVVLEDAIFDIRFPLLSQDYFTENISEKGLLTDTEEVHILKYYLNPKKVTDITFKTKERAAPSSPFRYSPTKETPMDASMSGSFVNDPDIPIVHPLTGAKQGYIQRFPERGIGWGYRGNKKDAVVVEASQDVRIDFIYVYGNCKVDGNMEVLLEIQDERNNIISSTEANIGCKVTKPTYEIGVENENGSYGVRLNADEEYHMILTIKADNGYYGKGGKSKCSAEGVDFVFKNSRFSSNNTSVSIGQLAGFKFAIC
ncbi:BTB/POZ domain-containing protein 2-like [Mercenaria mercenaria]|uniref:BTB/POZ domain-containing protein 2-like n=1 Tax=Mercenaria mercenaria TaxID=6596 RepID=UPI001E1D7F6E|nr:BTB/POZ domain-containing protein 2-like [Mercenaria mercenaria]